MAASLMTKVRLSGWCLEFTGARSRDGYGLVKREAKLKQAHRAAYEEFVGPIPDGLQLDHLCRNRACIRPDHLEPVTAQVNTQRSAIATRPVCLQGHPYDRVDSRGHRECSVCRRASYRNYYARS